MSPLGYSGACSSVFLPSVSPSARPAASALLSWVLSEVSLPAGPAPGPACAGNGALTTGDSSERRKSSGPELRSEWPKLAGGLDGVLPVLQLLVGSRASGGWLKPLLQRVLESTLGWNVLLERLRARGCCIVPLPVTTQVFVPSKPLSQWNLWVRVALG